MGLRLPGLIAAAVLSTPALADTYTYTWGDTSDERLGDLGGEINRVEVNYDTRTERLSLELLFGNQITDGFTFALSRGPDPETLPGQLAMVYVDATQAQIGLSAYATTAGDPLTTYRGAGRQTPDMIFGRTTALDQSIVVSASMIDTLHTRSFSLELDARLINEHAPAHADPMMWTGASFLERLGLSIHTFDGLETSYDASGSLERWDVERMGWFERDDVFTTQAVPAPSGAALLGLGGLLATRRRR
jgi:MYXO-CTERM domain-containing protein